MFDGIYWHTWVFLGALFILTMLVCHGKIKIKTFLAWVGVSVTFLFFFEFYPSGIGFFLGQIKINVHL